MPLSCAAPTTHSSRQPAPGLPPLHQWQLCKTCNSQLYNITAPGNNKRTTELTDQLRAQLGGSEYLLSTVAPHLGPQELRAFIAFLVSSAAAALAGTALADAMGQRPWARSAVYAAPATRAALRTVHAALVVAQTDPRLVCCPGCTAVPHMSAVPPPARASAQRARFRWHAEPSGSGGISACLPS